MTRNLKYVGQEPKIYELGIISKIHLMGRIVLLLPLISSLVSLGMCQDWRDEQPAAMDACRARP